MSITKSKTQELVKSFSKKATDTGSPEIQAAIFTHRIKNLTEHLKKSKKDFDCRLSLQKMVARRKKLLKYLKNKSETRYTAVIKKLNLRK